MSVMNKEIKVIENQVFPLERALYNVQNAKINNCRFAGIEDGESAIKEARDITINKCQFDLRYPIWHARNYEINDSVMSETCRAALWYCYSGSINNTIMNGIKCLRECDDVSINDCSIDSSEYGWKCHNVEMNNCKINSVYFMFESSDASMFNIDMKGKYSFQYVKNLTINNSNLDTKDAFWHSENVTVMDSVIKGEYLGWFSKGLTLINCKIIGTQPLCYCEGLSLVNCTMEQCDLSFEYSDVKASIIGHVDSIKNIRTGLVEVDSVGEIINEDSAMECTGKVVIR